MSGVWRAGDGLPTEFRFEVFGTAVNYFQGTVLTGFGHVRGVPTPCMNYLGFLDAAAAIPAWIESDGSFAAIEDAVEPPDKISAAIRRTAPSATVVALGYPQLFPDKPRRRGSLGKKLVPRAKQVFLRERGEQLNDVIRAQAEALGLHFVGVERAFAGHKLCGRKREWVHGLVLPLGRGPDRGELVFSFHPNERGQRAYARELTEYFGCLYEAGFPFRASGVPEPAGGQSVPERCR